MCHVWHRTGGSYCCPERLPLRTLDLISEAKDEDCTVQSLSCLWSRLYQLLRRAALNGQVLFVTAHFRLNHQPSLQPAWTECIIPHIENDTDRISTSRPLLFTELNSYPLNSFQVCWHHYVGRNLSVTGSSPHLLTARGKWILRATNHEPVHCQNKRHLFLVPRINVYCITYMHVKKGDYRIFR